jgi:protoporphyrinogen oxidase
MNNIKDKKDVVILGGGLAGLSAGAVLSDGDRSLIVFENDSTVGGLSKTVTYRGFRFDLGGHRFITKKKKIELFVNDLLEGDFLTVQRKSRIYMRNRSFDYPLRPSNAVFGLGISITLKTIYDYCKEKIRNLFASPANISLEDWVVSNFGRTMFNLYFKEYSEKVWGIGCDRICMEWVEQRIKGLSLGTAIKNAFFKFSGKDIDTLADKFIYPSMGIGDISDKLKAGIETKNQVLTDTGVSRINHEDFVVKSVIARNCDDIYNMEGREFVSSIPLTKLVQMLAPAAPDDILEAASRLKYRDPVIVTVMLNRERVTDLRWIYLPEQNIPLGRIHEPKNWSVNMAPEGKTHLVCEYFCFEGDTVWNKTDADLTSMTARHLERLGFIRKSDVIDSCVVRAPKAYPLFEVGYSEHYEKILRYLENFKNLHIAGRNGMFRYYNMDYAMESGIEVAENILRNSRPYRNSESKVFEVINSDFY